LVLHRSYAATFPYLAYEVVPEFVAGGRMLLVIGCLAACCTATSNTTYTILTNPFG
jgi:hypothetical protein